MKRFAGRIYLVGGGPGDPELLTVRAVKILGRADVVLHDSLVSPEVLALAAPSAERVDVGKRCGRKWLTQDEINALLVSYAASRKVVVRLKGGDPLLFGRAGEEIAALREAGVEFEIVPGITAAVGAAAAAGISLTDRRAASQVLFTTAERAGGNSAIHWDNIAGATTLVIYMPGPDYGRVAQQLFEAGWPREMPCVIVSQATRQGQEIRRTSLANLPAEPRLPAPALIIVGSVAARAAREISNGFWAGRPDRAPARDPVVH